MDYRKKFVVDPREKLRLGKLDPGYKGDHDRPSYLIAKNSHWLQVVS